MEMRIDDALELGVFMNPFCPPACLGGGVMWVGGCLFNVEFLADIKFLANLSGWQVLKSQILFSTPEKVITVSHHHPHSSTRPSATSLSTLWIQAPNTVTATGWMTQPSTLKGRSALHLFLHGLCNSECSSPSCERQGWKRVEGLASSSGLGWGRGGS